MLKEAASKLPSYMGLVQQVSCRSTVVWGTCGMPCGPSVGVAGLLEVKPTFLACISEATWQYADVEMCKLIQRARGSHALFHVHQVHSI